MQVVFFRYSVRVIFLLYIWIAGRSPPTPKLSRSSAHCLYYDPICAHSDSPTPVRAFAIVLSLFVLDFGFATRYRTISPSVQPITQWFLSKVPCFMRESPVSGAFHPDT